MELSVREALRGRAEQAGCPELLPYLPDLALDPEAVTAVLLNEIVPADPAEDFYGSAQEPAYLDTVFPLFREAGSSVSTVEELLSLGIYLTNAVKLPKEGTTVPPELLEKSLPVLEAELGLFPNLKTVLLMGDVAKKPLTESPKSRPERRRCPPVPPISCGTRNSGAAASGCSLPIS